MANGGASNWINYDQWLQEAWGWPDEFASPGFGNATNVVVGANPPYTVADFLSFYPSFGGPPLVLTGTITQGVPTVTGLQTTAGIIPGQAVASSIPMGNGQSMAGLFPDGTTVVAINSNTELTLSQNALVNGAPGQIAIYNAPWVPLGVMLSFICMASACLSFNRWTSQWAFGIALFTAHEITLYLRTNGNMITSAAQLAASGLAAGIKISKGAGGLSIGIQPSTQNGGLESYGDLQETEFGVHLARLGRVMGAGPLWAY